MKKKIKFYSTKLEAIRVSDKINNFFISVKIISNSSYTLEELKLIKEKLLNEKIELEINVKDNKKINIDKKYLNKTCKECVFYNSDYGCENDSSKVKSKHLKNSNSKGCCWGEWKNSGTQT